MQFFVLFWITLCLVVDTSTKSVTNTEDENDIGDLTIHSHWNADYNSTAEECKCVNGFCEMNANGKFVCKCPTEWGLYTATRCEKCNCGKDSNCTFPGFFTITKKCICKVGYEDVNGTCRGTCYEDSNCMNGANCERNGTAKFCRCLNGTEGDHCEEVSECKHVDCGPDARCTYDARREKAMCSCENKDLVFDDKERRCKNVCVPNPCQNGGTCNATRGEATCQCKDGFRGSDCSIDVCSPNPCQNGGTCNATRGKATCQCKDRFRGADCSMDVCSPNPCRNGGVCNVTRKGVICQCKERFRGADCSIEIPLIATSTSVQTMNITRNSTILPTSSLSSHSLNFTIIRNSTLGLTTIVPTTGKEECKCEKGFCERNDKGKLVCKCPPEWGVWRSTICRKCDCGKDSNCTFTIYTKTCICKGGYEEVNGFCREIPLIATSTSVEIMNRTRNWTTQPTSNLSSHSLNFTVSRESTLPLTTIVPTTVTDPCTESPCQNGGTCVTVGNTRKCLCKKPYLGILCETDPCDWNPCNNGGVCKIEYETVRCFCREPFTGEFCESRIRIDTYVITLVAGSVILTAILTFVTCMLCQRYHVMRARSENS